MSSRKSLTQNHIRTVILSEARGKFKRCQLCSKEFGIFQQEHQCKRCRRAVCQNCSSHKVIIITETGPSKAPHRMCNFCKEESDWIKRFIQSSNIRFGEDTYSVEWLRASGITQEMAQQEYVMAINNVNPNKDKGEFLRMKQELSHVMLELWFNLNFSLREFVSHLIKESDHEQISQQISRVLGALLLQYPDIGYSSDQVLITLFLLCFSSEATAYSLLTILYAEVVPFNTYAAQLRKQPYDYESEINKIIQVKEQAFKVKQSDSLVFRPFLKTKIPRYLQSLTVNFFLTQTTFFFFNQMFLNPKNGYDNLLKCFASAMNVGYEEIKHFLHNHDEVEAQLMKSVKSASCEKDFLLTKLIIFLNHPQGGMAQSVVITRQSEIVKSTHQIKPEHVQNQKAKNQIEREDQMLEYAVTQDNDFQILRRKTISVKIEPQQDEEKANLKLYVEKVEEALMLKHKLVNELQNRIKELQNQPPQIINKDADQQLLEANQQLRLRISQQDLEIQQLQEGKKYSDRIQQDQQNIISNLQKANSDLFAQLDQQALANKELQNQLQEIKVQLGNATSQQSPEKERNYQINISLNQKQSEEQLQTKLDVELKKIFQLEIQINQLNKECIALQQLNQDKLRIIGNLEVKLIETQATKREKEQIALELIDCKKKIEHGELVIIQQQEQLNESEVKQSQQAKELERVKREKEVSEQFVADQLKLIEELKRQLRELQLSLDQTTAQLTESLNVNQSLQNLIIEKDQKIENYNKSIIEALKKFEELQVEHHKQTESYKLTIQERDLLIAQLRSEIQQLRTDFDAREKQINEHKIDLNNLKLLIVKWEEKFNSLNSQHSVLNEKHRIVIIELDEQKEKWNILNNNHNSLNQQHQLIIIELNQLKEKWIILTNEHNALLEKNRLLQSLHEGSNSELNQKNNLIEELRNALQLLENKHNQVSQQNKSLLERLESETQSHVKKVSELDLLIIQHEKRAFEFKTLSENQRLEIGQLCQRIAELELLIKQHEQELADSNTRHQTMLQQIALRLEKLTQLENHNSKLELEVMELQKKIHDLTRLNDENKNQIVQHEQKIIVLQGDISVKEKEIIKLIQIVETQKTNLIDWEALIRKLEAKIVDLEKQNAKLKLTLKQFKELSEEMATID